MNQGLVGAWLIVTLFWSIVMLIASGVNVAYYPIAIGWSAVVLVISAGFGFCAWFIYRWLRVKGVAGMAFGGEKRNGAVLSLGKFPPIKAVKLADFDPARFARAIDFQSYKAAHPAHAALMLAIARYMNTVPNLPASPVPGGHGGANLIDHSINVVDAMGEVCASWRFEGHKNKDGSFWYQVKPVNGRAYHQFDPLDPILPLAAFAHDVGKVDCYTLAPDGTVTEKTLTAFLFDGSKLDRDKTKKKKIEHDTVGAQILRRMPELWALPPEDVKALLTAVGYYHKIGSLPLSEWVTDRVRSLVELVAYADQVAGAKENGEEAPALEAAQASTSAAPVIAKDDPNQIYIAPHVEAAQSRRAPPAQSVVETQAEAQGAAVPDSSISDPEALDDYQFERFLDVLRAENRINGKDARERIGFKYGDLVYVSDIKLRNAMSATYQDVWYTADPEQNRGTMHAWTKKLLKRLDNMGLLVKHHGDLTFSYKTALFTTVAVTENSRGGEERFVMIFHASLLPSLQHNPDCKNPPKILKCSFGDNKSLNKNQIREKRQSISTVGDVGCLSEIFPDTSEIRQEEKQPSESASGEEGQLEPVLEECMIPEPDTGSDYEEGGNGAWNLEEELKSLVLSGSDQLEYKKQPGEETYLFRVEDVVEVFGPNESDLDAMEKLVGGKSGQEYLVVRLENE